MSRPAHLATARGWSWLLSGLSTLTVVFWAWQNWLLSEAAREAARHGQYRCGLGQVALFLVCAGAALLFSALATLLAGLSYWRLAVPRPARRRAELLLVAHVIVLAACGYGAIIAMKAAGLDY